MSTKQLYQKEIEGKLEALDAQMAEMQAKADKAGADLKVQYYEQLRTLSERRETVQLKLQELNQSSEAAWETMKGGIENAYGELKQAFDKAVSQF
ncbi:MAG: coiled coil domain-containing protein [Cyanobacteria bacterium P01_A01_bin.137]